MNRAYYQFDLKIRITHITDKFVPQSIKAMVGVEATQSINMRQLVLAGLVLALCACAYAKGIKVYLNSSGL